MTDSKQTAIFKVVAVAGGTGGVGAYISRGLAGRPEFQVRILAQKSAADSKDAKEVAKAATVAELKALGASIHEVDYKQASTLEAALKGADVVVSALSGPLLVDGQLALIEAARKSGTVRRFIPSEYGLDNEKHASAHFFFGLKAKVRAAIVAAGLEFTGLQTGPFDDFALSPGLGVDFEKLTVQQYGSADVRFSVTSKEDIGRLVPEVLLRPAETKNKHLYFAGETLTWEQRALALEQATGKKWKREVVTADALRAEIAAVAPDNLLASVLGAIKLASVDGALAPPADAVAFNTQVGYRAATFLELALAKVRPIKTVAVVGASGTAGEIVTRGLLARPKDFTVRVLSRAATAEAKDGAKTALLKEYTKAGATIVPVADFKSVEQLAKALAGVDAVISTVGGAALGEQIALIEAATKAGVRRFVPSEFGLELGKASVPGFFLFDGKLAVQAALKKQSALEWTVISTGLFGSFVPLLLMQQKPEPTFVAIGSWDTRVQVTTPADIGRFTAEALLNPATRNETVELFGSYHTQAELADAADKAAGIKHKRAVASEADLRKEIKEAKSPYEFPSIVANLKLGLLAQAAADAKLTAAGRPVVSWNSRHAPAPRAEGADKVFADAFAHASAAATA